MKDRKRLEAALCELGLACRSVGATDDVAVMVPQGAHDELARELGPVSGLQELRWHGPGGEMRVLAWQGPEKVARNIRRTALEWLHNVMLGKLSADTAQVAAANTILRATQDQLP